MAQAEPPGRVGRLAFTNGTVSFHDDEQSGWTPAVINTPLTTGDGIWTEPNARSEISLAGTRIRMEGATQLEMLALDDTQTRLQLGQGRIDVKSFAMDANQPYEIVTPRGTVKLLQQGDYYVEAGSTEDPTRLGVRSGAAQIQAINGQVLAVRANEVAEVMGDGSDMQLRTIRTAPPAPPAYWANRDRQIVYDPPHYLSAGMTGYEDLNAYGDWINDGGYGRVWVPRAVPSGWAPYRTGHWAYVQPWGWTWIDEQPWGFAPYHYGRWANRNNRWVWVPPQRDVRPVYAPALVAFVGGTELAVTLGNQSAAPVGWFPLGPREVYVPPYTTNRDYYQRLNRSARVEDRILEDRWERAQRREAFMAGREQTMMNQRFATVVPTSAFVRSQPVMRSALQVQPQAIAAAPVAPVAAPPAPTASVARTAAAPQPKATAPVPQPQVAPVDANVPVAKTAIADMPTLAKPAATVKSVAPGPKLVATQPTAATDDKARQAVPALAPRQGAAPPELKGAITPAPVQPAKPGEPPKPQQAAPQPQAAPPGPAPAPQARPATPAPGPQQAKPAEPPKPQAAPPLPQPQQAKPTEPQKPQAPQQARPAEPPSRQAPQAAPQPQPQQARPEAPRQQPQAAPPPQPPQRQEGRTIEPPRQQQAAPPPPPRPAPPPPQQAAPPPQRQAPPPQQQAAPPQPAPQQQRQAAPPPQPKAPEQAQSPRPAPQPDRKDEKK